MIICRMHENRYILVYQIFLLVVLGLIIRSNANLENNIIHDKNTDDNGIGQSNDNQDNEANSDVLDGSREEYFVPTNDWKPIKEGQKIPAGLHVRINLESGLKEAKLLDEVSSDSNKDSYSVMNIDEEANDVSATSTKLDLKIGKLSREDVIEALKNIKSEDKMTPEELVKESSVKKKHFRSYEDLKAELKELHLNIESDSEILNRLVSEYRTISDENLKINILEDLDYLSHQIDNAIYFVDMGGIQHVIQPGLNSSNEEIRKGVLQLLGSASQSNPKVQIAAFEEGLLSQLLRIVAREKDFSISSKAVFAVSCLVRGFPFGQQRLIETGGLDTLREIFQKQDWKSLSIQLKVVSLIQDLLEERQGAEGERANQLNKINLLDSLVKGDWCSAVSSLLSAASFDKRGIRYDMGAALGKSVPLRPDHDMVDKIISTMVLLASPCKQYFNTDLYLLRSLDDTYSDLAYKEQFQGEDGHELFREMATRIQHLVKVIGWKDEL